MSKESKTSGEIQLPLYQTPKALLEGEAKAIFEALAGKTLLEVGYLFGLDRFYTKEESMKGAIVRAYNAVLDNPNKYGIDNDKATLIQTIVSNRSISKKEPETLREKQKFNSLDELLEARDISISLLKRYLIMLDKHPSMLKAQNIVSLAKVMETLFSKGQIVQGQATEHIAVMSNLPEEMNAEQAMQAILGMRDRMIVEKS